MDTTAGGWKAGYVSWIAGTKYNTGTAQDVYDLLNDIKPVITGSGLWELDSTIHTGSAVDAPLLMDNTNLKWTHGLFFVNKVSGSKMCITYTWKGTSFPVNYNFTTGTVTTRDCSLCVSVIPPNSGDFNPSNYASRGFVPDKGTPISTAFCSGQSSTSSVNGEASALCQAASRTDSGFVCYTFLMKDDVIGVFLRSTYLLSGTVVKGAFFGHVFDDEAVPCPELETDLPASNYGVVYLHAQGYVTDGEFGLMSSSNGYGFDIGHENRPASRFITAYSGGGGVTRRTAEMSQMTDTEYYSRMDGCWLYNNTCSLGIANPFYNTPGLPTGTSENANFSEVSVFSVCGSDAYKTAKYYKGDATKAIDAVGTLRGDMVLAGLNGIWTRGQTFGNKTYVYVGGGCVIGWDPSIGFGLFD